MANEIAVEYQTGKVLKAYIYHNQNGTMVLRAGPVLLTESPAESGLYVNSTDVAGLAAGDKVIVKDETLLLSPFIVGGDEYKPQIDDAQIDSVITNNSTISSVYGSVGTIQERTDKFTFTDESEPRILAQIEPSTGSIKKTLVVKDINNNIVADVAVWVSTDIAGNNVVRSGTTEDHGDITFYLTPGVYYLFARKAGFNFNIPQRVEVSINE